MQKQINEIKELQKEQGELLSKVYDNLVGDEFNDGLVSEVRKNSIHRKKSVERAGFIAGLSIVFGGLLGKFWDKITQIL